MRKGKREELKPSVMKKTMHENFKLQITSSGMT